MATYSKSLDDYFRIPILIKNITPLTKHSQQKISKFCHQYFKLPIDERYTRLEQNPHTDILMSRQSCTQQFYFTPEDFNNDWSEFEVIYKIRFAIGVIDEPRDEKQIEEVLSRIKIQNSYKVIGILDMGSSICENLVKRQNIIKYPDVADSEFAHFIEPWLYNCLTVVESEICHFIAETKKEDETNRTIVFNRMEDKLDAKSIKKKKKYRCLKICADYHLMLQLYREAFNYYCEAEEQLRKLDDYLWVLGAIQGKLACTVRHSNLGLSNQEEYIDNLINESYTVGKKLKNWNFEVENSLKIARLHLGQPEKFDQLVKNILNNFCKSIHDDEKFLLFTVLGELYGKCGLVRRKNMYFFTAALIHLKKKAELSEVLFIQIQKSKEIKEWPFLYKHVLQLIIDESDRSHKTNEYYLQLLSKCGNNLSQSEIEATLSQLNFSNHPVCQLDSLDFVILKDFLVVESKTKPKQNRIGSRESPIKPSGPGFFMSWKKDEFLLFQENEVIVFKGILSNQILFPIRLKITFQFRSLQDENKKLSNEELFFYLEPHSSQKFEERLQLKCATEQIWVIDRVYLNVWNFRSQVRLSNPIKLQIYQKQPELELVVPSQISWEESRCFDLSIGLRTNTVNVPVCLIKLSVSVYYNVDVGFQQNEVYLRQYENFRDIDFSNPQNLRIVESTSNEEQHAFCENGVLTVFMKKLKVHRKNVNRIEFNLEYIRSMNTKYQTSKHYVAKCSFYREFGYQVEEISTPTIKQIYKNPMSQLKIIEKEFRVRIRVTKLGNSQGTNSYVIFHEGKQYRFKYQNFVLIEFTRPKISSQQYENSNKKQLTESIKWSNIFHKHEKGEYLVTIPFNQLMLKCEKEVSLQLSDVPTQNSSKMKLIQYKIESSVAVSLSHSITLNPVELQIDRMYVLRGKSKLQCEQGTTLSNNLRVLFNEKCKNSYQIGIIFRDGWIYWHDQLLTL